ncbi:MAG: InlB B-repeat-containing protein [Clostridiales bacterium]|nr:InlB B-repeat-containing protein [Clostridiales bacterium]
MKGIRKFIYLIAVVLAVTAVSLVAAACGESDSNSSAKYTLTFMNGTAPYYTITGTAGSKVVFDKENPTRTNLEFDGWSEEPDGAIVELPTKMPAENKTYYAVFSARYTVTFDAGSGTLAATSQTVKARAGAKLYDLVSGVVPTAAGDSTFAAWYYNDSELSASSSVVMPAANITVEAKYTVSYVLREYKQTEYKNYDDDAYSSPETKNKVGFVGEMVSLSNYTGYAVYDEKDDKATTVALSPDSSDNTYNVYYNLRDIMVVFNHNLPDVDVEGEMPDEPYGYGVETDVPKCKFEAEGYRFVGWAKTASGKVVYRVGETFSVVSRTTLYAIWDKGYIDATGMSTDYIFVSEKGEGKTVYLDRLFHEELEGEYNETTHEFVFKNSNGEVFLRGLVDPATETFVYLELQDQTTYSFNARKTVIKTATSSGESATPYEYVSIEDDISDTSTLVVKANGDLVYTDAEGNVKNGTLSYDEDADSLVFIAVDLTFHFRLTVRESEAGVVPVFEIRDDSMYGVRYELTQNNKLDGSSYMVFDGYGMVTLYTIGFAYIVRSEDYLVGVTCGGYYYIYENEDDSDRIHGRISIYNNGYVKTSYLDFINSDTNLGTASKPVYKVYAYRDSISGALYAKPTDAISDSSAWEEYVQADTTAKIVLDGYGVYADSAVYTFKNSQGEQQTVKGKYYLDLYLGELTIYTTGGNYMMFISTYSVGEEEKLVFSIQHGSYTSRPIMGLGNANMQYRLRLIDDTYAEFAFNLPIADEFLGIYKYDLQMITMFSGTYKQVGTDKDGNTVYEFTADESFTSQVASQIFTIFYLSYSVQLTIDNFYQFTFIKATGYLNGQPLDCFSAVAISDGLNGYTITLDEITYTLNGYGKATSEQENAKELSYKATLSNGIPFVTVSWTEGSGDTAVTKSVRFVGVLQDDNMTFKRFIGSYITNNAQYLFAVALLEGDYALVGYIEYQSTGAYIIYYSLGTVSKTGSVYAYTELHCSAQSNAPILSIYGDFKFTIVEEISEGKNGLINIETNIGMTLTTVGVGTLTLGADPQKAEATFTDTDSKVYAGTYRVYEDFLILSYTTVDGVASTGVKKFRLTYDSGSSQATAFRVVGNEAGTWRDIMQDDSTMVLAAENYVARDVLVGLDPTTMKPIYKKFNHAKATYTTGLGTDEENTIVGEYYRTENTNFQEYCFIANSGADNEVRFLFIIALNSYTRLPIFKIKEMEFANYIFSSPTASSPSAILQSDGYNTAVLTLPSQEVYGTVYQDEATGVVVFTASGIIFSSTNSSSMYFGAVTVSGQTRWVILDGTVAAPHYGIFECTDGSGDLFGDGKTVVKKVWFTGYGIAYLITDESEDENGENIMSGLRVGYNVFENQYAFYVVDENNQPLIVTLFRLFKRGNGIVASDYTISFTDSKLNYLFVGVFKGENYTSILFDGFGSGIYVDAKGVRHNLTYTKYENDKDSAIIVRIRYAGENGYVYVVIALEFDEKGRAQSCTVLDKEDPRYPQIDEDDEEGAAYEDTYALAA